MIRARVRNWYVRNLRATKVRTVDVVCCGQGAKSRGGAYLQVRLIDDSGPRRRTLNITFDPAAAEAFADSVVHCAKRAIQAS